MPTLEYAVLKALGRYLEACTTEESEQTFDALLSAYDAWALTAEHDGLLPL